MYGLDDVTLLSERFFEFDRVSTSACMEENIELAWRGTNAQFGQIQHKL